MNRLILIIFLTFVSTLLNEAKAAQLPSNITPQQLEQFKRLPPAQQKSLAQSMGIDYKVLRAQLAGKKSKGVEEEQQALSQLFPRGTQYDELGNPIFDEEFTVEEEEDDGKPKPFGYEVFANEPVTFAPSMDIAIPENYLVGPGDTLTIQIFGKENNEFEIEVSREGDVVLPELGAFNVTGMTFVETKRFLATEIKSKILGVDVIVTLASIRSIRVFVLGDAYKPGQYVLNSLSSVTHAIIAAGGISDVGSLRNIQVKRGGKLVTKLDLYDLLIKGDSSSDLMLQSGDVVFIAPVGDRVTVDGEVKRPAIYELVENETFSDVIQMAGGLLPSAYPSSTVVEGFNKDNLRTVRNIDLTDPKALLGQVKGGDYVNVLKTSQIVENSVTVIGAVERPGKYQWYQGQRISDLIPNIHAYLSNDADLTYSLIVREKDIGRNIEVLQFNFFDAVSDKNSVDNIELKSRDKILVFSNQEIVSTDIDSLESLAFTKDELLEIEKENAEKKFKDKQFWQYYDEENSQSAFNLTEEIDKAEETLKQTYKSIEELTGDAKIEPELRELNFFSRKRLLASVIEQLKRQAASGEPLQLVEVDGAVKYPGIYPLVKNGRIDDLVKAAGGLQESAYLVNAEMTRNDIVQGQAQKQALKIDLASALAGNDNQNKLLKSKDRLNVHHIPAWQENHTVELKGEFMFPGKYTIRRGETLGQLIKRVGGFTDYAYLEGSLFTREAIKQLELKNLVKVSESLRMEIASKNLSDREGNMTFDYEQTNQLLADLTSVKPIGRLIVDIPLIMANEQSDVILENGDMLYIPAKQNSINVVGQVQVTSSHLYQPDLDAFDYVELSGGMKKQADDSRIYVIKANGRVEIPNNRNWFASEGSQLEPGDTVVVPLDSYYMEDLTLWQVATQIVYQASVALAAISNL
ncbi:SLBB domain-containing protein [Thalassotalea sp. G2M2-11]|uniref:SLBB domain-containing protein n=1 Tax=Thalassotalea sp. G2M2-11 TaxID=2787627 RepID=UPI0019D119F8|nr:SLBB domain-containing protein [Thalassotalea sp. G2M2-11]